MAVPDHIRKVPRPVNPIVEDNGRDGPNRFAVRERMSTKYISGDNPQPRNGRVKGHIRNGKYVPKQEPVASSVPDMLSYGASAFVRSVTSDILEDLLEVYAIKDAYTIMAVATLRIIQELGDRPDLHFLSPIKRNDTRIGNNDMLTFGGVLEGIGDHVLYKKTCIKGGRYLYAYRSARKAAIEEADYLARREKNKEFASGKYENKRSIFGVIVFESDLDMDPKTAYLCYDERWMLELIFRQYKNDQCLDQTNVQGDFSLMGSEFINFIATVATCRLIARAREEAGLLNKMSYKDLMDDLSSAWRMVDSPEPPRSDDGCWVHTITSVFEELEALGLSTPVPGPAPKKRGRLRKELQEEKPKRPRGRPRKNP